MARYAVLRPTSAARVGRIERRDRNKSAPLAIGPPPLEFAFAVGDTLPPLAHAKPQRISIVFSKGEKVGDLLVQGPTRFAFTI